MKHGCSRKCGYTLTEVLVVVAIMGILSGMGVAGLRTAVINSRVKDAGINVAAYMERSANEATRLNEKLCVVAGGKKIKTYRSDCSGTLGAVIDSLELEAANEFANGDCDETQYPDNKVTLTPKIGLSPIPSGCFRVTYGASGHQVFIVKKPNKYAMYYRVADSAEQ